LEIGQVSKELSSKWKALSESEKSKWNDKKRKRDIQNESDIIKRNENNFHEQYNKNWNKMKQLLLKTFF